MADVYAIKRNDDWRILRLRLEVATVANPDQSNDAHWQRMLLYDYVETARLYLRSGNTSIRTAPAVILDPAEPDPYDDDATDPVGEGEIAYIWQTADQNPGRVPDTASAGTYDGEVELTYMTGRRETVPRTGYFRIVINADLGQPA